MVSYLSFCLKLITYNKVFIRYYINHYPLLVNSSLINVADIHCALFLNHYIKYCKFII